MGIFSRKSKFEVKQEVIRVRHAVEPRPGKQLQQRQPASPATGSGSRPRRLHPAAAAANGSVIISAHRVASASPLLSLSSGDERAQRERKRKATGSSRSPASPILTDDDDGNDDDWEDQLDPRKRRKRAYQERFVDLDRKLRHPRLWAGGADAEEAGIIHAVEVASLEQKCTPVWELADTEVNVTLQYPGSKYPERHQLVWANDKIDAVKDIMKVVNYVACNYLPDNEAEPFLARNTDHPGIYRRLEKSRNNADGHGFKAALTDYNERLRGLQKRGVVAKHLDSLHGIPQELVAFILTQVYDRTVAPKVELLQKYKNGSDNVYGELLHPFISDILVERTKMTSNQVFVDLGSGVGNVVLQAALEIGCESWGCEMMENPCNLAEAQQREFTARCRLWGIAHGEVFLERGDFRTNDRIMKALKRADVILVNNQAFTSQLNDNLVSMFLDLKVGCKIISLKSFVHDHKNALNDVATSILDVEHHTYPQGYVSWTHASGTFCISTRK